MQVDLQSEKLFRRYPSLIGRVKTLRRQMMVRLQTLDKDVDVEKDVGVVVRRLVDKVASNM